jgi:hypothetical protein
MPEVKGVEFLSDSITLDFRSFWAVGRWSRVVPGIVGASRADWRVRVFGDIWLRPVCGHCQHHSYAYFPRRRRD